MFSTRALITKLVSHQKCFRNYLILNLMGFYKACRFKLYTTNVYCEAAIIALTTAMYEIISNSLGI